ncbi:hypothetical protein BIV25_13235 [Streptomyces sp. MUSC 14]|uniref:DUF6624 domain-containing protein n=1 Tax=Streptomyces sp. MUSC 14 TaxID=1354889 RepID=UPI0008F55A58|nr:DUF6624 domain-containing protein [Streptomyces sp. MUSC 14]OIJ97765.1 hypothetical protein BIV25_13235 [Streptomyces sp. MUSC 14]
MTTQPQRLDLARTLLERAERARAHRVLLVRGLLSPTEIDMERHVDHADAQVLRRILTDQGWPGTSLVGEDGAEAAWHLALHADHDPHLQQLALGLLATAVEEGEAKIQQWAHLLDRCAVNASQPQVFGTQHVRHPAGIQMLPTQDPEHLDARRASVGLPAHATAYEALRQRHRREPETEESHDDQARSVLVASAA